MPLLSDFLGSSVGNAAYQQAFSTVTAADAVSQGDPLAMLSDGTVTYSVPPTDVNATLRPLSLTADASNTVTKSVAVSTGTGYPGAVLTNGNVVVPFAAVTTGYPGFSIYSPAGALVNSVSIDVLDASSGGVRVVALAGGGLAIAYVVSTGIKYGVYDNSGTQVTAPAILTANASSIMGAQALSGGGFSLLWYYNSSGRQVATAAFNAAGTQQGTTTAVETVGASEAFVNYGITSEAMAQYGASGGYCVVYAFSTGGQASFFVRLAFFNSSAVLQGSLIALSSSSALTRVKLITLTDGTVVIGWYSQGTAGSSKYAKYSTAGAQLVAPTQIDAGQLTGITMQPLASATFGIFYNISGTDLTQKLYNSSGAVTGSTVTYSSAFAGITANFGDLDIKALSDGTYMVVGYGNGAAAVGRGVRLAAALTGSMVGTVAFALGQTASTSNFFINALPVVNPATTSASALIWYPGGSAYYLDVFNALIRARTFIGVATAAAAGGAQVRMQIVGPAAMTRSWAPGLVVNYQANAIPGQKASLIGSTAILLGIQ